MTGLIVYRTGNTNNEPTHDDIIRAAAFVRSGSSRRAIFGELVHAESTARDLYIKTGIYEPNVYRTIKDLGDNGIVEVSVHGFRLSKLGRAVSEFIIKELTEKPTDITSQLVHIKSTLLYAVGEVDSVVSKIRTGVKYK